MDEVQGSTSVAAGRDTGSDGKGMSPQMDEVRRREEEIESRRKQGLRTEPTTKTGQLTRITPATERQVPRVKIGVILSCP